MAKVLVIDDDPDLLQMIRLLLEERGGHEVVLSSDSTDGLTRALADPPDLAIIDVMMPEMTGYEVCRRLREHPHTALMPIVILTARGQTVDQQAALAAGADEHIPKPVTMAELLERVNRLLGAEKKIERMPGGLAALFSLRGGVGVTTLAVNLAATLSQAGGDKVCLVDLCPSSGHAALQLGMRPERSWAPLAAPGADPERAIIEDYLLTHESGLRLLASPFTPAVGRSLPGKATQVTLSVLRKRFATVVVDVPSVLDKGTLAALESADGIGVVLTAESPSIQATIAAFQALKQLAPRMQLVLNRVTPGPQPSSEAVQKVLKRPLAASIPFDPAQAHALARGAPLALSQSTAPLARAVRDLASELLGTPTRG